MLVVLFILLIVFLTLTGMVFSEISAYGKPISKKNREILLNLSQDDYHLNIVDNDILSINGSLFNKTSGSLFISKVDGGIMSKYYVYTIGTIPRWEKATIRKIEEYYSKARSGAADTRSTKL